MYNNLVVYVLLFQENIGYNKKNSNIYIHTHINMFNMNKIAIIMIGNISTRQND